MILTFVKDITMKFFVYFFVLQVLCSEIDANVSSSKTACHLKKKYLEDQIRVLDPEDAMKVVLPKCQESDGMFEEIQCNTTKCWCVDQTLGFEKPDTRVPKGMDIDCKIGRGKCLGPTCRMFCDHGFSLDENGCQKCKCFNPCQEVNCPGSNVCQIIQVDCASGKCPVPSCRKPRTLESLCPIGSPLLSPGGKIPLPCGNEKNKPQCPSEKYKCNVQEGKDYGACCPFKGKLGECPKEVKFDSENCTETCDSDMDCMMDMKCCSTSKCGSVCVEPVNNTLCMQQKEITLLKGASSIVPGCSSSGEFLPKQCRPDKKMCWCVDLEGVMIEGSIKLADEVMCEKHLVPEHAELRLADSSSSRRKKNPCKIGAPLRDEKSGAEIFCGRGVGRQDCPNTYTCEIDSLDTYAVCCATQESIKKTKLGECPEFFPEPRLCPRKSNGSCISDSHCPDNLHCCPSVICGSLCTEPDVDSLPDPNVIPTTCEYLRNLKRITGSSPTGRALATHNPRCDKDGIWEPAQCNQNECWCVDEFGDEIARTRGKYSQNFDCRQARENDLCAGIICRLGCDYGFKKGDDGCPICECRDPCDDVDCGDSRVCIQRDVECGTGFCRPVATCEPKKESVPQKCPGGSSPLVVKTNAVVTCDNKYLKCPNSYECYSNTDMALGICCSQTVNSVKDGQCPATGRSVEDICVEQCQSDNDCSGPQKCCINGCGAHVCVDPIGVTKKPGQCPLRSDESEMSCDFQCTSDFDCSESTKCCSNGCGTSCVEPRLMTACEFQQEITEHRILEDRRNRRRTQVPSCQSDGSFESIQCDSLKGSCWCVDVSGLEVPGTRTRAGERVNCDAPSACPPFECDNTCINGYVMDGDSCSTCKCKDPCEEIVCQKSKECRVVEVQCVKEPCPPVALCLPRIANPCEMGEPLKEQSSDNYLICGPNKNECPSSHACKMSPFDEYAVCCPKPKSTCEQEPVVGMCRSAIQRWYFDSKSNTCDKFTYGGCGGNLNNFKSKEHCQKTCPTMTSCQKVKRKSRRLRNFYRPKVSFQPKCESASGKWNNIQCLESFGLCWCVDKKGMQISGTLIRGTPKCNRRGGRTLEDEPICEEGESVNICKDIHCKGLKCKANPNAVCRINPCGSCHAEFYDEEDEIVDCHNGLSNCEKKRQEIINSHRWRLENGIISTEQPTFNASSYSTTPVQRFKRAVDITSKQVAATMLLSPPECLENGDYKSVQYHNGLSWCVDEYGDPTHDSLTSSSLECNSNGDVISKETQTSVCPGSKIPSRICNEACLNAHCSSHPDAFCVADPCNNCQIHFIDSLGHEVNCDHKCDQVLKEGDCDESIARYFFNKDAQKCEKFTFKGCSGNDNNFKNMEDCQSACVDPVPVCEQPKEIGICRMHDPRWFYNTVTQRCEEFVYGGCKGNDNNFLTKEACESRCPDEVVCRWTKIKNQDDIKTCSRSEACAKAKCLNPEAICKVDPCTCEPSFVDINGQEIECSLDNVNIQNEIFDKTSCETTREEQFKMESSFIVGCDQDGNFLPLQCSPFKDNKEMCWCVDDAGKRLVNSTEFERGDKECENVKIKSFDVSLTFENHQEVSDDQFAKLKDSLKNMLTTLSAEIEDDITLNKLNKSIEARFTLVGENKLKAAHNLRQVLKRTLRLEVDGNTFQSDYKSSRFEHEYASSTPSKEDDGSVANSKEVKKSTVAYLVIFSILSLMLIVGCIAFVTIYKKRKRKYTPKRESASLVSSSC